MGRPSTGAWTVYESTRIELSYLIKQKYLVKGNKCSLMLSWTDQHGRSTGSVGIICSYLNELTQNYIQLNYTVTNRDGQKTDYNYKIFLIEVESNLGKGKVLYFKCPETGKKCRVLYQAYGSDTFKCRQAYKNRLYYDCQHSSKLYKYNDIYWRLDKYLDRLKKVTFKGNRTYNGVLTRNAIRYNRLHLKQWKMDELRWTVGVPKSLRGKIFP